MRGRLTKVRSIDLKKEAAQKISAEEIKTNKEADKIVTLVFILLAIIVIVLGLCFGFPERWYMPNKHALNLK
ncbi:hypothetical protein DIU31_021295 [Mucilaginibacter rubeus]|uniref:Uncharacterized protein n=1 Tax=Mucilaginibacter rubeus TaxID=2027860 RepID=A0AAE6JJ91_9SPHI|nr:MULTISPECIES: hypothetical protein [Mucilaginibacter]QEM05925.1 hypothetical protein DIU31_021295 [Mucilaginibacter rubeus]QEM18505.1 hypothetical protein DIU38_021510 [Mucilaginibacter gossypii]QTE44955.1 hypothetical protein J3L19_06210 [Mucilaginibacter rubeus]QTE51552.1 hypothetical protein J3L21_06185 [Mucilaginibacter rubeus]QTE56639.1 hypothetical protein J3L23_31425 [Mucilaginibacter rubeus]